MLLEGKSVIVTGGTGAVGSALCDVLSREGASVAFNYEKNKDKALEVQSHIEENGRRALAFQCSVLDKEGVAQMVKKTAEEFGKIDILVNNAGIVQVMPFPLIEEEEWDLVMDVNVKGMFIVTKEVVRHMVMQRSGVIINMGSIGGVRLLEVPVHYAASKAAVGGFSIALAKELARYNIRVNTVVPGMLSGGVGLNVPEKQYNEYMKYCAAARPGKPEEVAEYVAFLVSDRAQYINAQNLLIDGGL
ncbi:MAG TPA: 3-oxoacyl-ACP reductase family protein [Ignavibacteriales bacterium]|nr:3-oxoacyl-ACP reductase family protein [Ignavibacteriales bacterium]